MHRALGWGTLMKTPTLYNMILQAEENRRTAAEVVIYAALIASTLAAILHLAVQPVVLPGHIAANQSVVEYRA